MRIVHFVLPLVVPFAIAASQCAIAQVPDAERTAECATWLRENAHDPIDYVVGKFDSHQCVIVGEMHEVRQTCAFVASLVPRLFHEQSVLVLATEFLRARQSDAMNRLLTAEEYDEVAVIALMRDGPWPTWGYQDYADIFRAVWQVNHDKLDDGPAMRVLGLDSDWRQHDLWFGDLSRQKRMGILLDREQTMIGAIADGPMQRDEKVLVHCGYAHSVTCHGARLGTVLTKRFGERVFQVAMHHELRAGKARSWLTEWLEKLLTDGEGAPIAFDLGQSPFADLRDPEVAQWRFVPKAGIGDLCHGYVFLAPVDELQRPRWVPGFITAETFEEANDIAVRIGYVKQGECNDAAELDAQMAKRFVREP